MSAQPLDEDFNPTTTDGWVDPFYDSPPTGKVVEGDYGTFTKRIMKLQGEWRDENGGTLIQGRPRRWRPLPDTNATRNACSWKAPMVKLADGREVPSDSQEWLLECEARHILNLPSKPARLELLDQIEKRRGPDARRELEVRILTLWELSKRNSA